MPVSEFDASCTALVGIDVGDRPVVFGPIPTIAHGMTAGVSGSVITSAISTVPSGIFDHRNVGVVPTPSQVYSAGMLPPAANASEVSVNRPLALAAALAGAAEVVVESAARGGAVAPGLGFCMARPVVPQLATMATMARLTTTVTLAWRRCRTERTVRGIRIIWSG